MADDFFSNLQAVTDNISDIAFTRYATITNLTGDGTCTAKEDEEGGLTHENVLTLSHNLQVGDKVVLGFVDNSIYNPVILTGGEEAYTKTETDALLNGKINTSNIANNLTTTSSGKVLDARQGKALADLIGGAIHYINQQVI